MERQDVRQPTEHLAGEHPADGTFAERADRLVDPVGARALYDAWAPTYDDDHGVDDYWAPGLVADRVAALYPSGADVLDAACGTGLVGAALAARGFTSIDGLDLSPAMVAAARRRRVYHDLGPADLTRRLPGAPDKFTVLTCVGAMGRGHLPGRALTEFARVVRPGGHIVLAVARLDDPVERGLSEVASHGLATVLECSEAPLRRDAPPGRVVVLEVRRASAPRPGA